MIEGHADNRLQEGWVVLSVPNVITDLVITVLIMEISKKATRQGAEPYLIFVLKLPCHISSSTACCFL